MKDIKIENKFIGEKHPTYFIADIAANHDGDLEKAKDLIYLCAEAGADAAKFQHFKANTIVSDLGFKSLGAQQSHQANWKKSVFDVYKDASINPDWTPILKQTCDKAGITFLTLPYSYELVDKVNDKYVYYRDHKGVTRFINNLSIPIFNVNIELWNYKPVNIDTILKFYSEYRNHNTN